MRLYFSVLFFKVIAIVCHIDNIIILSARLVFSSLLKEVMMNIRYPYRAGTFYESASNPCRLEADRLLDSVDLPQDLPSKLYGGLVPHAGWMYSGHIAATTIAALAQSEDKIESIVLLGADHVGQARQAEVYDSGTWRTPLGDVLVDSEIASALIETSELFSANPGAHEREHSLEVQIPLLQAVLPNVRIVPIAVPPTDRATDIGRHIGHTLMERFPNVPIIGSTDLTHHGGHFPTPGGHGEVGVQWSRDNDKRMLDLIEAMNGESIVAEANLRANACGAGSIAATVSACRVLGGAKGLILEYSNSYDVIHRMYPDDPDDTTVGYASVVFA